MSYLSIDQVNSLIQGYITSDPFFHIMAKSNTNSIISQTYDPALDEIDLIATDSESRILVSICASSSTITECYKCRMLTKKEYFAMMSLIGRASNFRSFIAHKILMNEYMEEYVSENTTRIKVLSTTAANSIMASIDIRKVNDDTFIATDGSVRRY
jgi:hypothetical protein